VIPRANGNIATLNSPPDGIDCGSSGSDCSSILDYNTTVTLQAAAITGSRFVSWTGVTCAGGATNATCVFPLRGNVTATPTFRDVTAVALSKTGQGTIVSTPAGINCVAPTCADVDFTRGVVVKLTATPATGWSFTGWTGDPTCPGTVPCSFNASVPSVAVTATFAVQSRHLNVVISGFGSVSGPGVSCSSGTCGQDYDYGTQVTLTPSTSAGYHVVWSGACSGTGICSPVMNANKSVTATFKQN